MKRLFCSVLCFFCILCLPACQPSQKEGNTAQEESINVPPVRFPKVVQASYHGSPLSFEDATESSEVIARVIVEDWLGDHSDFTTMYSARVIDRYKGECPDEIIIFQDGNSEHVFGRYPLYAPGDELVLFLHPSEDTPNGYFNNGSWYTTMYVFEYKGTTYLVNPAYVMFKYHQTGRLTDAATEELVEAFMNENPIWRDEVGGIFEAYALELDEVQKEVWGK